MIRLWMAGVCCLASVAMGEEPDARTLVERANQAYADQDYATALEGYRQAEVTLPESPELAYNRGLAHYKLGEFGEARDYFNRALRTRDLELEAKTKFNLGNVAYASALEKLSDLQEAIDLLKTAIGQYRDTLELTPDDEDAKENIETAHLLIKDLLDKLKKQQEEKQKEQQQEGDQDQEQQNQEQQQDGEQQNQDQDGSQQDGQESQEDKQSEQEQNGQQEQSQDDEAQQDQKGQGQQQQEAREMTGEEAERLLQSVRDRERQRREDRARRARAQWVPVLKDW